MILMSDRYASAVQWSRFVVSAGVKDNNQGQEDPEYVPQKHQDWLDSQKQVWTERAWQVQDFLLKK